VVILPYRVRMRIFATMIPDKYLKQGNDFKILI